MLSDVRNYYCTEPFPIFTEPFPEFTELQEPRHHRVNQVQTTRTTTPTASNRPQHNSKTPLSTIKNLTPKNTYTTTTTAQPLITSL